MRGKQTALMPGNEDPVGYWLTPPEIMGPLQKEFDFNYDACPYPRPAGFDGLKEPWGTRTWVNPPYEKMRGMARAWAMKAIAERDAGRMSVIILPISWLAHDLIMAGAEARMMGKIDWVHPDGSRRKSKFPTAIFILRPYTSGFPRGNETESEK